MKRLSFLFLAMVACMVCVVSAAGETKKTAVYVTGKISDDSKTIISSAFLSKMSGNKQYAPYERNESFIDALNAEQDYQVSGEMPEGEIRKVASREGVDYVIVAHVTIRRDNVCNMSARLINLETGAVVKSVSLDRKFTGSEMLTALANNVAYRLLNKNSK